MNQKENILGTKPVRPLLLGMAFPIMLSMLVQALYNVVDSIFVARLSEDALAAVGLAFPIQSLMISVSVGTAIGVNALVSRRLGEQDTPRAQRAASNGLFLVLLTFVVTAVAGGLLSGAYMGVYHQSEYITTAGADYLRVCTVFSLGLYLSVLGERIIQTTGKTVYQMISQMTGAVVNIILDPILIFGYFGAPALGVTGAAVATVIGQFCSMAVVLVLNHLKNHSVKLSLKGFRPSGTTIRRIYQIGLPSIIMQSIGSIMTFGMNQILGAFSSTAVAVFNVYFKLQSFVFMPVFGLTNAMIPIISFNYGAQKRSRIIAATKTALATAFIILTVGAIVFISIPQVLLGIFSAGDNMVAIGSKALRIIGLSYPLAAFSIVFSTLFQALGSATVSMRISILRQLVLLLPSAYLLARFFGLDAVWFSFPFAEVVAIIASSIALKSVYENKLMTMPDDTAADDATANT